MNRLLGNSHARVFTHCLYLLSRYTAGLSSYDRHCTATKPKRFIIWPCIKGYRLTQGREETELRKSVVRKHY